MTEAKSPLRKLAHAIYRDFFSSKKLKKSIRKKFVIFLIFARRGGSNEYHNLCFGAKIRFFLYIKVRFKGGIYGTDMFS